MLPPRVLEDIDELVGQVQTEDHARLFRRKIDELRNEWRRCHPQWHTDRRANDVDQFLSVALDRIDELIACHGQC